VLKKERKVSTYLHARFCQIQPHRELLSAKENVVHQNVCKGFLFFQPHKQRKKTDFT